MASAVPRPPVRPHLAVQRARAVGRRLRWSWGRGIHRTLTPLLALGLVCVLSLGARAAWLQRPCQAPCRKAASHLLIFDEDYYVNAARVIAGVRPPTGVPYAKAPLGDDPNAEHPQLAKLVMAGLIQWLGDGPWAWRLGSLIVGTLALLGMYALARAAGATRWLAVGATTLMAFDNLLIVHGRIATLDIYVLAGMLWGVAAYVRGRPWLAGAILGVAACAKMVAPFALLVVAVFELEAWLTLRAGLRRRLARLAGATVAMAGVLIGLLALLDEVAPPYDNSAAKLVGGGPLGHLSHMFSYAAHQTSPHGPRGIASYPWQWLYDHKSITYMAINPSHPHIDFEGLISQPLLFAGLLGLLVAGVTVARRVLAGSRVTPLASPRGHATRQESPGKHATPQEPAGKHATSQEPAGKHPTRQKPAAGPATPQAPAPGAPPVDRRTDSRTGVAGLALAWFTGTFVPFVALSGIWQRTSYLYYMVIVMPGLYLAAATLAARVAERGRLVWVAGAWAVSVAVVAVVLYPVNPFF